ncbi:unnamed protein product [Brassica rapa]|uniref:Uncharacterized protein n=1 Tax=Brassica campestris TaxID=3711 RepID=A0A8D9GYR4_BRACM|nr:unnamed protein product [Brassica rapa]
MFSRKRISQMRRTLAERYRAMVALWHREAPSPKWNSCKTGREIEGCVCLSSKDINFVGYTYKNVETVNEHQLSGIQDESAGGTTSYQGSFLKHLPPQIQKFQRKSANRAHHPDDTDF